jgi:hypothetical protein
LNRNRAGATVLAYDKGGKMPIKYEPGHYYPCEHCGREYPFPDRYFEPDGDVFITDVECDNPECRKILKFYKNRALRKVTEEDIRRINAIEKCRAYWADEL